MKRIDIITIIASMLCMVSCNIDKSYFGQSDEANITLLTIQNQLTSTIRPLVDHADTGLVEIVMSKNTDLSNLTVTNIKLSSLAHTDTDVYSVKDFTTPLLLEVIAEDESYTKMWKITVECEGSSDDSDDGSDDGSGNEGAQLNYSTFDTWTYMLNDNQQQITLSDGTTAYTPGDGSRDVWSTTAQANAYTASGINYFTTYPMPNQSAATYARMETVQSTTAALFANSGVIAGALFTGSFVFNAKWGLPAYSAPRKMINFGTPFYDKPKQVKFKYRYAPGSIMKDGNLNDITTANAEGRATKDSCEVYFILHNRNDADNWVRVGAAWLRSGDIVGDMNSTDTFKELTLDFVYGEPSATVLTEKPYMKIGGVRGELTFYSFTSVDGTMTPSDNPVTETYAPLTSDGEVDTEVTHLSVMLSSSAYGDLFWAATNGETEDGELKGSTLDVKEIEFIY